ncbi:hypothetical protein K501DRAFT_66019 [Backusella circina FSU 941]|nr:hypothetical protein K501DRAFT_66019 [Backusella circina FSU 941]
MVDTMGSAMFLDPEVEAMVLAFFCVVSLVIVSLFIWLIFLCLRVDGVVDWKWWVVFIPLWVVDLLMVWASWLQLKNYDPKEQEKQSGSNNAQDDHEQDDDDEEEDEEAELLGGGDRSTRNNKMTQWQHILNQYTSFVLCCLAFVFQLFIVLELDHYLAWPIPALFAPYFAYEVINFISIGTSGLVTRTIRLLQVTMIMVQVSYWHTSWFIVFIPLYLLGLYYGMKLYGQYKYVKLFPQREEAEQGKLLIKIASVIYAVLAGTFYVLLALIARRLEGYAIKMGFVFIPVFIVMSILLCCTGCCLPCMLLTSSLPMEDLEGQDQPIIDVNRRIAE